MCIERNVPSTQGNPINDASQAPVHKKDYQTNNLKLCGFCVHLRGYRTVSHKRWSVSPERHLSIPQNSKLVQSKMEIDRKFWFYEFFFKKRENAHEQKEDIMNYLSISCPVLDDLKPPLCSCEDEVLELLAAEAGLGYHPKRRYNPRWLQPWPYLGIYIFTVWCWQIFPLCFLDFYIFTNKYPNVKRWPKLALAIITQKKDIDWDLF